METFQAKTENDAVTRLEAAITSREDLKKRIAIQRDRVNEEITQEFKTLHCMHDTFHSRREREKALHSKCEKIASHKLSVLSREIEEMKSLKNSLALSAQEHIPEESDDDAKLDFEPGEKDDIAVLVEPTEAVSKLGQVLGGCDPTQCTVEEGLAVPLATARRRRELKIALRGVSGELVSEMVSACSC